VEFRGGGKGKENNSVNNIKIHNICAGRKLLNNEGWGERVIMSNRRDLSD
jgi:hypothetical protein